MSPTFCFSYTNASYLATNRCFFLLVMIAFVLFTQLISQSGSLTCIYLDLASASHETECLCPLIRGLVGWFPASLCKRLNPKLYCQSRDVCTRALWACVCVWIGQPDFHNNTDFFFPMTPWVTITCCIDDLLARVSTWSARCVCQSIWKCGSVIKK